MYPKNNIPTYVLCGGKSMRMGTEKGLVSLQNKTFTELIIKTLNKINTSIFLVTENSDYEKFGKPLIPDLYKEKGPLGGIYTALSHAEAHKILILSCDIPLITTETLQAILNTESQNKEILFAVDKERWHPLIGIYSKSLLPYLESAIRENRLKLIDFIKDHNYLEIKIADDRSLRNINTVQELAELEKSLT